MIPARSSLRHGDGHEMKNGLQMAAERENLKGFRKSAVGLDLGRRLLVVLKHSSKEKAQAIRVVDHGEQQKEALRRLFDAQVLLQSYEEQLHQKDEQLSKIQVCVKKAIRESNGDLREPELVESLGLDEFQLQAEGITVSDSKPGASKLSKFEAMIDQSFENQKWEEKQERERKAKEAQAAGGPISLAAVAEQQSELQWFKVPYWLKADEETREMVQKIKEHFIDEMNSKGHFDHASFHEHLWQCGLQVAQHWAGSPNEELIRQAEVAEKKARSVQREALQESSMLRQHIKRVERKYKELQSNVGKMQKAMSTMASQLKEARENASLFGDDTPSPSHPSPGRRNSAMMGFGGGQASGQKGLLVPPGGAGAATSSPRRMSAVAAEAAALPEFSEQLLAFQGAAGPGVVSPLHGDDTLEIMADQMQLEEMDNEIFEPLNQFDDDLKDLMIDCITEKVRRILSLDPSKYKNGRLPFGLKPHKGIAFGDDVDLEEELQKLREMYDSLKEENEALQRQLEAARAAAERWKMKYMELRDKAPEPQELQTEASRPRTRTPETPKETGPEPAPVIKGLSDEEVQRLLAEQEKAFKAKLAALEKQIKLLEEEIKRLKDQKKDADAKAKDEADKAKKERERRETLQKEQEQKETAPDPAGPVAPTSDSAELSEALAAQKRAEQRVKELEAKLAEWLGATRQTMEAGLRGFTKLASITGHKVPQAELKFMQGFGTSADPSPGEVLKAMREASPKFEVWVSEALAKYKASFAQGGGPPTPPKEKEEAVRVEQEAPKEVTYKGDPKEVQELKRIAQRQQEEISKLLLTIDELRKRMENIKIVSLDAGPGVAGAVDSVMEKVGLKDIMEAGVARNPPVLKGVFERLYSDAIQRIQRYGLIRQQMLLANKAYAAVVEAASAEQEELTVPDFERLNETTDATIRGMWYHTEHLFRRACEYAMTQGVEASLVKAQQSLVSEFEAGDFERAGADEIKAPRRERARKERAPRGLALKEGGGGGGPLGPPKKKGDEPTPFMSYMAALREVQGELAKEVVKEGWQTEKRQADGFPKTLKDACDRPGQGLGLATSRSLPALPRNRNFLLQAETDGISPFTKAKLAATMT
mmetsp:Transcript_72346/g.169409  ORF Transcript_72346/g.169409 Transcript_72346/m.169409 type:complete len:1107 (-) Transcript_72346:125-3445(-)